MKVLSIFAALVFVLSITASAQKKQLDLGKSQLDWLGKKVTGEHNGTIAFKSGWLLFEGDELSGGEFIVDMSTIKNIDLEDEEYNQKLVGHLKSDDFFGVQTYPSSKLELLSVKEDGKDYHVNGKLTIKDKTHPIHFKVAKEGKAYTGKMLVDRTKYDIRYGSGKFFDSLGDRMIYDEFELSFKVYTE